MGKPMTNYNERLDEVLDKFFEVPYPDYNMGILPGEDGYDVVQERRNYEESYARDEAKQALTSLIKELVAEARPSKKHVGDEVAENRSYTGERLFNATIDEYHTNLLKALEEK